MTSNSSVKAGATLLFGRNISNRRGEILLIYNSVPGHDHAAIGFALDAGASIVCPQVDTVEQARHIVSAAKYGAIRNGTRSAPPARLMPGLSDKPVDPSKTLHECVNDQAAIMIQIETLEGIKNLDAILTECGEYIDSVWLGSLDARISMGFAGMGGAEPEWLEAVALYESTLAKHNQAASGFSLGTPEAKAMLSKGKSFLMVAADFFAIVQNGSQDLATSRTDYKQQNHNGIYKRLDV
jgi:4-hydroxy-2-oxoheptanedioate aldolase